MTEEPHQIPPTWVWTNVDTLYDVIGGGTPSTKIEKYWNGDVPWITSADINDVKKIVPRKHITKEAIQNSATKLVPENSIIVVTRVGLGKVALTEYPLCFSQDSQALVGDNSLINPNYSVYYLSTAVQEFKYKHRGTTIAGVPRKQLKQLPFPLPPYNEQVRIVDRVEELFSRLDAGMRSLQAAQTKLEQYRHTTLRQAYTGKLTRKWRQKNQDTKHSSVLIEKIKKEFEKLPSQRFSPKKINLDDLSDLPDKWSWVQIGEVFYITLGQSPPSSTYNEEGKGLPFFQGSKEFGEKFPTIKKWCSEPKKIAEKNDVLISVRAPVGDVNFAPEKCCIGRGLSSIRALADVNPSYIYHLIKFIRNDLESKGTGTTFKAITGDVLRNQIISLPPLDEINIIVDQIERSFSIFKRIKNNLKQNIWKSERMKQSILKKAFEGRLVPQDLNNEPASVLLERIKAQKTKQRKLK